MFIWSFIFFISRHNIWILQIVFKEEEKRLAKFERNLSTLMKILTTKLQLSKFLLWIQTCQDNKLVNGNNKCQVLGILFLLFSFTFQKDKNSPNLINHFNSSDLIWRKQNWQANLFVFQVFCTCNSQVSSTFNKLSLITITTSVNLWDMKLTNCTRLDWLCQCQVVNWQACGKLATKSYYKQETKQFCTQKANNQCGLVRLRDCKFPLICLFFFCLFVCRL